MYRRRIGKIVRRHIHRLDRGDSAGIGVGDALLQLRQLGAHRGLIAQARRHLPHQAGYLHAGLDEPKDIIDQQQHVAMLVVPEILGHRQRRMTHAETGCPGGSFIWPKTITMFGNTPASFMSRYSSSPSRHRSPIPQKMLTPFWCPIIL